MSINNRNPRAAPVRNIGETGSGSNSREVPDWGCPMRTDLDEVAWDPRVSGVAGERRRIARPFGRLAARCAEAECGGIAASASSSCQANESRNAQR